MGTVVTSPAVEAVAALLRRAKDLGASDLHLDPSEDGVVVRVRADGVLETIDRLPAALGPHLVGRLKALSGLLAYRTDVPQEGRIPAGDSGTVRSAGLAVEAESALARESSLSAPRPAARPAAWCWTSLSRPGRSWMK